MQRILVVLAAVAVVSTGVAEAMPVRPLAVAAQCDRPADVQPLEFDGAKYPHIRRHTNAAIQRGWPKVLVLNRPGEDARRERRLADIPTKDGFDRDEYPPAVGRGRGPGLVRGRHPRGWRADVRYVPSSENRSHGASLGNQLRPFCNGTRFE